MKRTLLLLGLFIFIFSFTSKTYAHCEMPCGIYNDEMRIQMIKESIETIEKAMDEIAELQSADNINYNQLVRWVNTKEEHAGKIQEICEQYFLTQRVKFADPSEKEKYNKYVTQLKTLHEVIVYAMKSKQTIDKQNIDKMRKSLAAFEESYFGEHQHNPDGSHK
jgi:nickel superoxide dismutase